MFLSDFTEKMAKNHVFRIYFALKFLFGLYDIDYIPKRSQIWPYFEPWPKGHVTVISPNFSIVFLVPFGVWIISSLISYVIIYDS